MSRLDRLYDTIDQTKRQETRLLPEHSKSHHHKFNVTTKSLSPASKKDSPFSLPTMYSTEYRRDRGRYAKKTKTYRKNVSGVGETDFPMEGIKTSRESSF